jgi:hypothetical protein
MHNSYSSFLQLRSKTAACKRWPLVTTFCFPIANSRSCKQVSWYRNGDRPYHLHKNSLAVHGIQVRFEQNTDSPTVRWQELISSIQFRYQTIKTQFLDILHNGWLLLTTTTSTTTTDHYSNSTPSASATSPFTIRTPRNCILYVLTKIH